MRIVVPIKQVPQTDAVRMDEKTGTMIREGVEAIVNPLDLYAIESALQLRQQHGGEVIAISMGPAKAMSALAEAVAMGFDQAILLSDKCFAGSDTWATSYVLAAGIRRLQAQAPVDLIICGERATDGDTGQVGPGVAGLLDLPVVGYVSRFQAVHSNLCRLERLVEDGYEQIEVQLPAVLTVVKEVAEPRLPTLRGKQRSRKIEIPTWSANDLGIAGQQVGLAGSPTRVVKIFRPSVARKCQKLVASDQASIEAATDRLLEFLQDRQLL